MLRTLVSSLLLWFIEFLVVAALISESWTYTVMRKEQAMTRAYLGEETAQRVLEDANSLYRQLIVDTGIRATVYKFLIPTEETRRRSGAMADLGRDNVFPIAEERLNVIFASLYQVVYRLVAFGLWVPYVLLLFLPALIDGLMVRQIKKTNFDYASPLVHRVSMYAIAIILYVLLLALFAPLTVPPWTMPLAGGVIALGLGLLAANTQKRI